MAFVVDAAGTLVDERVAGVASRRRRGLFECVTRAST